MSYLGFVLILFFALSLSLSLNLSLNIFLCLLIISCPVFALFFCVFMDTTHIEVDGVANQIEDFLIIHREKGEVLVVNKDDNAKFK